MEDMKEDINIEIEPVSDPDQPHKKESKLRQVVKLRMAGQDVDDDGNPRGEVARKNTGRVFQDRFDEKLEQIKIEVQTILDQKQFDRKFGKQHEKRHCDELIWNCRVLIEGSGWHRVYPTAPMDEFDQLSDEFYGTNHRTKNLVIDPSKWKAFSAWPELCAEDVIGIAKYQVNLAEYPLLKRLTVRALEGFVGFAEHQKENILKQIEEKISLSTINHAIDQIKNDTIFVGIEPLPDSEPPRPVEEQQAEYREQYRKWEAQGRDLISVTKIESPEERRIREQTELEGQIVLTKQQEDAAKLAGGGDVFQNTPRRR